ncbi:Melanization Protease 1 [Carabus blaptoides fortunei]
MLLSRISLFKCVFGLCSLLIAVSAQWDTDSDEDGCRTPDGVSGTCIEITGCKYIVDTLENAPRPLPAPTVQLLQAYHCGFAGTRPKVCCPLATTPPPSTTPERPPDVSNHRNINMINSRRCGPIFVDRIYGGNKTSPFEFPWMALIAYNTKSGLGFRCGGTLISDKYILTAAHCISNLQTNTLAGVRVGEHNIISDTDCDDLNTDDCAPAVQDFSIAEVIPHPQYSPTKLENDIGLLRLSGSVNMTVETVKTICLPTGPLRTESLVGKNGIVAGWGATETGYASPELLKVELPVITQDACQRRYNQTSTPVNIGPQQLCAGGTPGKDSCQGDSGGPLKQMGIVHNDARFVQYGIVSFVILGNSLVFAGGQKGKNSFRGDRCGPLMTVASSRLNGRQNCRSVLRPANLRHAKDDQESTQKNPTM